MTTFNEALKRQTAILYAVTWWPEDWGLDRKEAMTSYIVAKSLDEAASRCTSNNADIKKVVVYGGVIERLKIAAPFDEEAWKRLPTRVRNAAGYMLADSGGITIDNICAVDEAQWLRTPNFGKIGLAALKDFVRLHGRRIGDSLRTTQ